MGLFKGLLRKASPVTTYPDMCKCSKCGWEGNVGDCEQEYEQESWEMPGYWVHLCPVCDDGGCIDDYWFSK